ncbi:TRAP transporter small permease subunit [Leucothrix pacifica]|uniref:TRAP transporter small permease protein n=1 Tax=Leucothrix pacifica TaxID=1247513 RepID=A0A317CR26_9GAMM|nr:TRAP transporter small permease subunit [Leucothrix pacifica]PWQ98870.1 C4-dicarboxylate ABC transporter [Leucothrix pacifica]
MGAGTAAVSTYRIPVVEKLNSFVERIGNLAAWVNVILIAVILASVFMRYGMNQAMVTLEELTWYLYAVGIMFGLSYGVVKNSHIRVDILHSKFPRKLQYAIEIFGLLFLLLPFAIVIFHHSLEWVWDSYAMNEASSSPQGLSHRWIIKSVIPVSFFLLIVAGIARLIQSFVLFRHDHDAPQPAEPSGRISLLRHMFSVQAHQNETSTEEKH